MAKKQNDEVIKYAKYAGIGLVAYVVLKPILASAKAVSQAVVSKAENTVVKDMYGLTDAQVKVCNDIAAKLNLAMYDKSSMWSFSWFGGSFEDEEKVIAELNRVSTSDEANCISDKYQSVTGGKNLKQDVDTYLSSSDIQRIKTAVYSGLK